MSVPKPTVSLGTPMLGDRVNPAYANPRPDVLAMVPGHLHHVLDVGCSTGHVGEALRQRGHAVTGIESDPELATEARTRIQEVIESDVEYLALLGEPIGGPYDCIVFADVLEHLRDPWGVVRWAAGMVAPGGAIVVSVPNVAHAQTLWALIVRRRWPYRDVGIFDRTHLRWFSRRNLAELFGGTEFQIVALSPVPRILDRWESRWNRLAPYLGDFGAFQFVLRAERRPCA